MYQTIAALSALLLSGVIVHGPSVTVGRGIVVDWRTIKSGEEVGSGLDPFEAAHLFVSLVGIDAANAAVTKARGV